MDARYSSRLTRTMTRSPKLPAAPPWSSTGAHAEAAHEQHLSANPDMIALNRGRPVLVAPDGYDADGQATRALVTWDTKRSSARAIGDAMDILANKASATPPSVGTTPRGSKGMVAPRRLHRIEVTARIVERPGSAADTVLAETQARGARLVVMGAFEHSTFSHDLPGGVTTDVIRETRRRCFLHTETGRTAMWISDGNPLPRKSLKKHRFA